MINQDKIIKDFERLAHSYKTGNYKEDYSYIINYKFKTDYRFFKFIPNGLRGKKVLDVGAFIPLDAIYWGSVVKEFHAIDISKEIVDYGNKIIKLELSDEIIEKIKYCQSDATKLNYDDNYFDVVFSFSTIEHIPNKESRDKVFSEISRVTKRKGFVIITLPNKLNYFLYKKSMKAQKLKKSPFGFELYYTPKQLKKILIRNNLKPLVFNSSAGDYSGDALFLSSLYNKIINKFGVRMGWLAQKL